VAWRTGTSDEAIENRPIGENQAQISGQEILFSSV
jgi:hypothetical protein